MRLRFNLLADQKRWQCFPSSNGVGLMKLSVSLMATNDVCGSQTDPSPLHALVRPIAPAGGIQLVAMGPKSALRGTATGRRGSWLWQLLTYLGQSMHSGIQSTTLIWLGIIIYLLVFVLRIATTKLLWQSKIECPNSHHYLNCLSFERV